MPIHDKTNDFNFLSIESFISNSSILNRSDFLRGNRFEVRFYFKQGLDTEILRWHAFAVNVSGIELQTEEMDIQEIKRYYLKNRTDDDLQISFLESADLKIRKFFYDYLDKYGLHFNATNQTYRRNFVDEYYISKIEVVPYFRDGKPSKTYDVFEKCLLYKISDLNFDLSNEDQLVRTDINFKFKFHKIV